MLHARTKTIQRSIEREGSSTETQIISRLNSLGRRSEEVSVIQSCLTLFNPMDRLFFPWNSPGKNTWVGSLSLLQGIVPNQRLNPSLLHCRQILPNEPLGKLNFGKKWKLSKSGLCGKKREEKMTWKTHSNTVHKKARIWYLRSCVGKMHCVFLCFLAHSTSDIICRNFFFCIDQFNSLLILPTWR